MSDRNPFGARHESWVDRQIREASERGEFEGLPGSGKPLSSLDDDDELWWVKGLLRREGVSVTPPALALRKQVEDALDRIERAESESAVRDIVAGINERIVEANRKATTGPASNLMPLDAERVVRTWSERKQRR